MGFMMRTTIAIDDHVLAAAKAIAKQRNQSVGKVVSDLAHNSQHPAPATARNGIALLPVRRPDAIITLDIVNDLRDELLDVPARRENLPTE
jgi:hypothetical protein